MENHPYKRIIVCCDGTWYSADSKDGLPSNVALVSRAVAKYGVGRGGQLVPQISYYQSGVGTHTGTKLAQSWQGAFGTGLAENVAEAYNIIAGNWAIGDEIFIFGFSRGAFTARSIAGLICEVGLLAPTGMEFFYEMYAAYKAKASNEKLSETAWAKAKWSLDPRRTVWQEFSTHLQKDVKIKVVGVWDTVGSLGLPDSNWLTKWTGWNRRHQFHNTRLDPKIENAFHAVSLDERRGNFRPTLWYLDPENTSTFLRQCWFPGYHGDVGGGTASGFDDPNEIDEITFAWMCDQVAPYLSFDPDSINKIVLQRILKCGKNVDLPEDKQDKYKAMWEKIKWGMGTTTDTLTLFYRIAGGTFMRCPGETKLEYPDGTPIPRDKFREEIHPSVHYRIKNGKNYSPKSLAAKEGWSFEDGKDGHGRRWIKTWAGKEVELLSIKEYVIPHETGPGYTGSLERKFAPKKFLEEMDKAAAEAGEA